jgi:beta-glucanase (GH16 family)
MREAGAVTTARSSGTNAPPGGPRRAGPPYRLLFLGTAVLLVAVLVVLAIVWSGRDDGRNGGGPSASTSPQAAGAWRVVWRDDFNGPDGQSPDRKVWILEKGNGYPGGPDHWGTGEVQHYNDLPEDVSTDGKGHLLIKPHLDVHNTWESARIETQRSDFRPPEGGVLRAEARIRLPAVTGKAALGYWPAFWMLGSGIRDDTSKWPAHGEFDILENVNGDQTVHGTLHCGVGQGGPCHENTGLSRQTACPGSPCQGSFHVYALEWDRGAKPEELRWYVDGKLFHSVKSTSMDSATWAKATHGSMTVILNVAMGGGFPDGVSHRQTPTATTRSGVPMVVDYVSVTTKG